MGWCISHGSDSGAMYGYWPAGGIDSHGKGATDHSETETPNHIGASIQQLNTLLVSYSFPPDTCEFTVLESRVVDPLWCRISNYTTRLMKLGLILLCETAPYPTLVRLYLPRNLNTRDPVFP